MVRRHIGPDLEWQLNEIYGFTCANCGYNYDPRILERHHITPVNEGGEDSIDNLIRLCPNCHKRADNGALTRKRLRELRDRAQARAARRIARS